MRLLAVAPGSTLQQRRTLGRLYEGELAGLRELGVELIHTGTPLEALRYPIRPDGVDVNAAAVEAAQSLRKEAILARVLVDHMRQQNLLAWNRIEVPEPTTPYTVFNNQVFTAWGFSYLSPLVYWKPHASTPTACPVVIDCYHDQCTPSHVASFAQRLQRVANRGTAQHRILGVIGARDFQRGAWDEARRKGFIVINFRQLFGEEALNVMAQIEELIRNVTGEREMTQQNTSFGDFARQIRDLKTNPVVAILRAIGFEALTALLLRSQGYERVELGRIVPWEQATRDVDVFGMKGDELRIVECKACHRKKSISPGDVRKFFTETVPATKLWLRSNNQAFKTARRRYGQPVRKGKTLATLCTGWSAREQTTGRLPESRKSPICYRMPSRLAA